MEQRDEQPWYRQFWPWFIMVPPAVAVVAGLLTAWLAGSEPAMVVDDYGRIAMATAQRADRAKQARELGLVARISFPAGSQDGMQQASVALEQNSSAASWPDILVLQLIHPTLSGRDQTIELSGSMGRYSGRLTRPAGRYYVSLGDEKMSWRLTGELRAGAVSLELSANDAVNNQAN